MKNFSIILAVSLVLVAFVAAFANERVKINMGNGQVRERITGISASPSITIAPGWAWRLDSVFVDVTEGELSEGEPVTVTRESSGSFFDGDLPITGDLQTTNPQRLDFDPWTFGADDSVTISVGNAGANTFAIEVQYTVWDK